jgi:large subunit ribosomal protein L18
MIKSFNANKARLRRHRRVRKRVQGTAERPRLSVFRSAEHIYAQIIDDQRGHTLVAASSLEKAVREAAKANGASSAKGAGAAQQTQKASAKADQAARAEAPAGKGEKAGKAGKAEKAMPPPPPAAESSEDEQVPPGLKGIATNHKVVVAQSVGRLIAERARAHGITRVVFDRGGYIYHGRVAALAAGAREGGLDF